MSLKYRPEIDGLRALAVVSVVIYHAQFSWGGFEILKGGFIGVDIFFVISGYLITTIILKELAREHFSFLHFYERRARRILPALFTVMIASLPFALWIMQTKPLREYAGSVLAALAFSSNIWFWSEDSYTAEPSALKPFLHTWSLSLEEQFYLIFPVFLLLLWKYGRRAYLPVFLIALAASLHLAHIWSRHHPDASFFLLPTRGWELLAGAILAKLELDYGRINEPFFERWMPPFGLLLISASLLFFHDKMRHPDYITLVPVIGTMLLIRFASASETVSRLLSARSVVFIGLISYSFYLWHFPIFAFARIALPSITDLHRLLGIALAFILAVLTYRLIEQPARKQALIALPLFIGTTATAFAGLLVANSIMFQTSTSTPVAGVARHLFDELVWFRANCPPAAPCQNEQSKNLPALVNFGDSHSFNLDLPLKALAQNLHRPFVSLSAGGCPYILGTYMMRSGKPHICNETVIQNAHKVLKKMAPALIVYTARLPIYLDEGRYFDNLEGGRESEVKSDLRQEMKLTNGKESPDELDKAVIHTLKKLVDDGHRLVLVYPIPAVGWHVPDIIRERLEKLPSADRQKAFENDRLSSSLTVYKKRTAHARRVLDLVGKSKQIIRIYPDKLFCSEPTGRCLTHDHQALYYIDDDHLSRYGAQLIVDEISKALQKATDINRPRH